MVCVCEEGCVVLTNGLCLWRSVHRYTSTHCFQVVNLRHMVGSCFLNLQSSLGSRESSLGRPYLFMAATCLFGWTFSHLPYVNCRCKQFWRRSFYSLEVLENEYSHPTNSIKALNEEAFLISRSVGQSVWLSIHFSVPLFADTRLNVKL